MIIHRKKQFIDLIIHRYNKSQTQQFLRHNFSQTQQFIYTSIHRHNNSKTQQFIDTTMNRNNNSKTQQFIDTTIHTHIQQTHIKHDTSSITHLALHITPDISSIILRQTYNLKRYYISKNWLGIYNLQNNVIHEPEGQMSFKKYLRRFYEFMLYFVFLWSQQEHILDPHL